MNKPKTRKQKEFIKNLASGDTPRQAAIKAGFSPNSANHSAKGITENYREYIEESLKTAGITLDKVLTTLAGCLDATWVNKEGQALPDYQTRIKAVDISLKLHSAYPAEKREINGSLTFKDFVEKATNE